MDVRNRGLVVAVYILFGAALTGVAALCWAVWTPEETIATALYVEPVQANASHAAERRMDEGFLVRRQEAYAEAARRIKQLEVLLERKTDLLNRRTELLNKRAADYDALRAEADRYLMLLLDQFEPPPPGKLERGETPTEDAAERDEQVRDGLQAELRRLREDVARSALLEEVLESELDQVRAELDSAQDRVAEAELVQLLGDPTGARAAVPTEALVRVGEEATPVLMAALRDERSDIRRWAAGVLEEMGPQAKSALPALRTARTDTDPAVRQTVRRALAAINGVEP